MSYPNEIYSLKNDTDHIEKVQAASLDQNSHYGLKIENGLLFGTPQWFEAIETGLISTYVVSGKISKVYMSGHNDFPEFEISDGNNTTAWQRHGIDNQYIVGKVVNLSYVLQKFKRGGAIKCVISIKIGG